eukprot:980272_1
MKYVRVLSQLLRVLTTSDEGSEYHWLDATLKEIFDELKTHIQNAYESRQLAEQSCFYRTRFRRTLAREYFTLMGILSESKRGNALIEKQVLLDFVVWNMSEGEASVLVGPNDYLWRCLATSLDYGQLGIPRMILSHFFKCGSVCLRKALVAHMRLLFRSQVNDFEEWGLRLLGSQLTSYTLVSQEALSVLEEVCSPKSDPKFLIHLVLRHLDFSAVRSQANPLFLRMLSTSNGVKQIAELGWINDQMDYWANLGGNVRYVQYLEENLVSALSSSSGDSQSVDKASAGRARAVSELESMESWNRFVADSTDSHASMNACAGVAGVRLSISPGGELEFPSDEFTFSQSQSETVYPASGIDALGDVELMFKNRDVPSGNEYYYDRLSSLPFTITVTIVHPSGKAVEVLTDSYLAYSWHLEGPIPGKKSRSMCMSPRSQCVIVAHILDNEHNRKPRNVSSKASIRAKLSIGGESVEKLDIPKRYRAQICTPDDRRSLSAVSNWFETPYAVWEFNLVSVTTVESHLLQSSDTVR